MTKSIAKNRVLLGELLIKNKIITQEELLIALNKQKEYKKNGINKRLGGILTELGFATEKEILEVLSKQIGFPFVDLYAEKIDYDLLSSFPLNLMEKYNTLPFKKDTDYIYIATADPLNYEALEFIEKLSSLPLKVFVTLSKKYPYYN